MSPGMGGIAGAATLRGGSGCAGGAACGVARGVVVIGVSVSAGGLVSDVDGTGMSAGKVFRSVVSHVHFGKISISKSIRHATSQALVLIR